jgi:hypothetical protein
VSCHGGGDLYQCWSWSSHKRHGCTADTSCQTRNLEGLAQIHMGLSSEAFPTETIPIFKWVTTTNVIMQGGGLGGVVWLLPKRSPLTTCRAMRVDLNEVSGQIPPWGELTISCHVSLLDLPLTMIRKGRSPSCLCLPRVPFRMCEPSRWVRPKLPSVLLLE